MKFYFAPIEGVTGYIYRNAYEEVYGGSIDKYFAPFIVASQRDEFKSREINDIMKANNSKIQLVPQILANDSRLFLSTAKKIEQLGYEEINLNLGCPSGTVVAKGKGAGFLKNPDDLDHFLEEVFSNTTSRISIKTRICIHNSEEFSKLLEIFNQYPLEELIIHPRLQIDFYKNHPNIEVFEEAIVGSQNSLCYNGDIFTSKDYKIFVERFPQVEKIMIGRGLLRNPNLINEIQEDVDKMHMSEIDKVKAFHDRIYLGYQRVLSGDTNVLYKMKEVWTYLIDSFPEGEKHIKKLKKAEKLSTYEIVVNEIFKS